MSRGASRLDPGKEFRHKFMPDTNVIGIAKIALDAFQPPDKPF